MAPRGPRLSETEIRKVLALTAENVTPRQIAKQMNRSPGVIYNLLRDPLKYGKKNPGGRPSKLSRRDKSVLLRAVTANGRSARHALLATDVAVSVRTVQRLIQASPHHKWSKINVKPPLKQVHIRARQKFADDNMATDWNRVIFTDEKKFNLDGPDGLKKYWHDIRKEPKTLFSRRFGGGSLMVWAGFSAAGKTSLAIISGTLNASGYVYTLMEHLLPNAPLIAGANWILQQDNASVHTAQVTKQFFSEWEIPVLEWPARSPDINPIENLWGILVRMVYSDADGGFRQFASVNDLRDVLLASWSKLDTKTLQDLVSSMPNRIKQLIKKDGKSINY